jgi:hypothetical protein
LTYATLKRNRRKFLALTGLTPREFKGLLPAFGRAYEQRYPADKTLAGKPRKRQAAGGCKGAVSSVEQKLVFALV